MRFVFLISIVLMTKICFAQIDTVANMYVMGFVEKDKIHIRWALEQREAFMAIKKYGFRIERLLISRDSVTLPNRERTLKVFEDAIVFANDSIWKSAIDTNKYARIVAAALLGEYIPTHQSENLMINVALKHKEEEQRFFYSLFAADQSYEVAKLMGLGFTDTTVMPNEEYLYRIIPLIPSALMKIDTALIFLNAQAPTQLPGIIDSKVEFTSNAAEISWSSYYYQKLYTGYLIEKSVDGCLSFFPIDKNPIANIVDDKNPRKSIYTDYNVFEDTTYYYRIRGVSPFGKIGSVLDTIHGKLKIKLHENPDITVVDEIEGDSLCVKWTVAKDDCNKIQYFIIQVSDRKDSLALIKDSIPANGNTSYAFSYKPSKLSNFINLYAITNDGQAIASLPETYLIKDNTPPLPPVVFNGHIERDGRLLLEWSKVNDPGLLGYRIYYSYNINNEFTPLEQVSDTFYNGKVHVHTLTDTIYYKLRSTDYSYNYSEFSPILAIPVPDVMPPAQPFITRVINTDSCVHIYWTPSYSNDVIKHQISKKFQDGQIKVFTIERLQNPFLDFEVEDGINYQYTISATDEANNSSYSDTLIVTAFSSKMKYLDNAVRVKIDRKKKQIELEWNSQEPEKVKKIFIYRQSEKAPRTLIKSIYGFQNNFIDRDLRVNEQYSYFIKFLMTNNTFQYFSSPVKVIY